MSKKKTKKPRHSESGDVATERCAKCVTRAAAKQALRDSYWTGDVRCSDCGFAETLSEIKMLYDNARFTFQTVDGQPAYTWRCPVCGVGLITVTDLPPRLVRHMRSKDKLF